MSDNFKHEFKYEEHSGFNSVLLFSMDNYDPKFKTPKKGPIDSVESPHLSSESLTPGATPKDGERKKSDSKFLFCLSRDLLQRLEECSPEKIKKKNIDEDEEMDNKSTSEHTPTTIEDSNNEDKNTVGISYYTEEIIRKTIFNDLKTKEGEIKAANIENCNNNRNKEQSSRYEQNGFIMRPQTFFPDPSLLSNRTSQQLNDYQNVHLFQAMTYSNNTNYSSKSGWICLLCNNFNYEIRIKCNRCGHPKSSEVNRNLINGKSKEPTINSEVKQSSSSTSNPILINGKSGEGKAVTNKKKKPFVERAGDWTCFKCKNLNFSFRIICNRCQLSKKDSETTYEESTKNTVTYMKINDIIQNKHIQEYIFKKKEEDDKKSCQ